jgi:hypothetical protein
VVRLWKAAAGESRPLTGERGPIKARARTGKEIESTLPAY